MMASKQRFAIIINGARFRYDPRSKADETAIRARVCDVGTVQPDANDKESHSGRA